MSPPRRRWDALAVDVDGVLVDTAAGLSAGLVRVGVDHAGQRERLLEEQRDALFELLDALEEYRPWPELLAESLVRAAARTGTLLSKDAAAAACAAPAEWPLFEDAGPALARLAPAYPVVLLGNFDRAVLAALAARAGLRPSRTVAGPELESYTSDPDLLLAALHETEIDEDRLLYVGAIPELGLYTAEDIGVPAAFVDRRGEGPGEDLTVAFTVPDATGLAARLLDVPARRGPRPPSRPGDRR